MCSCRPTPPPVPDRKGLVCGHTGEYLAIVEGDSNLKVARFTRPEAIWVMTTGA